MKDGKTMIVDEILHDAESRLRETLGACDAAGGGAGCRVIAAAADAVGAARRALGQEAAAAETHGFNANEEHLDDCGCGEVSAEVRPPRR